MSTCPRCQASKAAAATHCRQCQAEIAKWEPSGVWPGRGATGLRAPRGRDKTKRAHQEAAE